MFDLSELLVYTGETPLELIVWPIFIGICIGAFLTVFIRVKLGELIRALIAKGACSPETAQGLEELGCEKKFFIRRALKGSGSLRKVVYAVKRDSEEDGREAEKADAETLTAESVAQATVKPEKINVDECRFYIPDSMRDRAQSTYDNTGSTIAFAFLTVLVFLIVTCASMIIIPNLIQMFENMLDGFRNK